MSEIVVVASGNELADIMMLSVKAGYPTDHNLEHEQNVAASAPPTCQGIQCHRRNGVMPAPKVGLVALKIRTGCSI